MTTDRERAGSALALQEREHQLELDALAERYRRVVEVSNDAILITDPERRISFANPSALALFGYGSALLGMSVARTVAEEARDEVREREDRALRGEPQRYEAVVRRADGERRLVEVATAPLEERGTVVGIVASLRDVTEERRARDAVAKSESRYRNLFESASDAIYTVDLEGSFTSVNEATVRLAGLSRTELLGRSSRVLFDEDELTRVKEEFRRAVAGHAVRFECRLRRADGGYRLVSVTNTPVRDGRDVIGVLGVARDITVERERAAALERSEARYTRLMESASDGIFTVDSAGRFTGVNRALERGVGRRREELLGAPLAGVVDVRDLATAQQLLHDTFAGERCRGAVRYHSANGAVRHGSLIMSPVVEEGAIVGALGIMRDVTDDQHLAEQLLHQEKLAAVGQLVSGVAHELNNPLAGVLAFAQLLLSSGTSPDAETRQAVETIHHEATRAAKIVSSLLTFAQRQTSDRADADINAIVTDTLALRRYALRAAGIELDVSLDPALPRTTADPFQLQQVILNHVTSAEQALAEWLGPRRIAVQTAHEEGDGSGEIVLRVSHTGPGRGDTFVLRLPVHAPPEAEACTDATDATDSATLPALGDGRRLLVVDDEPAMRTAIGNFLSSLGHAVTVAAGGLEARGLLERNEYDVVLLDLRMPDLGGDDLYRELVQRDPRHARRVVFVTGNTYSTQARRFLADAGRPSVSKPFQLDDLATVVAGVKS